MLCAKCTTQSQRQDASSVLGYMQNIDQCINIMDIYPRELPLSESHQKVKVSLSNLPKRNVLDPYDCYISSKNVSSTLVKKMMLVYLALQSSQLPTPSSETGKMYVELAVYSVETKQKILSMTMAFYTCTAISSCLKCTTGLLSCSWCHYEAACVGDTRSSCQDSFAPWVSDQSSHQCPFLNSQTVYIPAGIQRKVVVNVTQLPEPKISNDHKCIIEIVQQSFAVQAWWNNSTSLPCGPKIYNYSYYKESVLGHLQVELGKSTINHVNKSIPDCASVTNVQKPCGYGTVQHVLIIGVDGLGGQYLRNATATRPGLRSFTTTGRCYNPSSAINCESSWTDQHLSVTSTMSIRSWTIRKVRDVNQIAILDTAYILRNYSIQKYIRKRFMKRRISYSTKSSASFNPAIVVLTRSGINIVNPGPEQRQYQQNTRVFTMAKQVTNVQTSHTHRLPQHGNWLAHFNCRSIMTHIDELRLTFRQSCILASDWIWEIK